MVLDVETLAKAPSAIEFSASGVVTALKPMTVFPCSISKLGMLRAEIPDN
jgi:3-polyprenyl-4-hydroxybenzoate decarboxylase